MKEYFIEVSLGFAGKGSVELTEAENLDEAHLKARTIAEELADSYGFEQDFEYFKNYDSVGILNEYYEEGETPEDEKYDIEGELEYSATLYIKELHEGLL